MDVYSEYTGLDRFSNPAYDASLLSPYTQKYAARLAMQKEDSGLVYLA